MNEFELKILLEKICAILGVPVALVKSNSREQAFCDARTIYVALAAKTGAKGTLITSLINKSRFLLNDGYKRYLDLLQYNSVFREKVLLVERGLKEAA